MKNFDSKFATLVTLAIIACYALGAASGWSRPSLEIGVPDHSANQKQAEKKDKDQMDYHEKVFVLSDAQLQMIRKFVIGWSECEAGAPGVDYAATFGCDPKVEDPSKEIIKFLGMEANGLDQKQAAFEKFEALEKAFRVFVNAGTIKPGHYTFKNHYKQMFPSGAYSFDAKKIPVSQNESVDFELSKDHIKLLKHLNLRGLFADPKRPYGDMTYFEIDMADALGIPVPRTADGKPNFSKEQMDRFARLHTDMMPAMQVMVLNAQVPAGKYTVDENGNWHAAKN